MYGALGTESASIVLNSAVLQYHHQLIGIWDAGQGCGTIGQQGTRVYAILAACGVSQYGGGRCADIEDEETGVCKEPHTERRS